ncbi:MAG TPA: calcium/sodium antiporter [Bryobacterales bacterium]|nr:calcium/sodium antiporter [Bryobacterales bacterium]
MDGAGWSGVAFVAGFLLLIVGAELLVQSASRIAAVAGVAPIVIGLTIVAYGTSAPEAAVSVRAVTLDPPRPDIAVGNVVGSNIANILLVLGIGAALAPVRVHRAVMRWNFPAVIGVSALTWLMALDGNIQPREGLVLLVGSLAYTAAMVIYGKVTGGPEADTAPLAHPRPHWSPRWQATFDLVLIFAGLVLMVLGADWMVDGASKLARMVGVSELVISLSIVAVGTSLPEIATTAVATLRGRRDIAVGNAIGSNLFNLLLVLGLAAVVAPQGIPISGPAQRFDFPIMFAVVVVCWFTAATGSMLSRFEGVAFLATFGAYVLLRYGYDLQHVSDKLSLRVPTWSITPALSLAPVILLVAGTRAIRRRHQHDEEP